jgi:hypothetical protein
VERGEQRLERACRYNTYPNEPIRGKEFDSLSLWERVGVRADKERKSEKRKLWRTS